jgi:hypothetical protein
MKKQCFKDCPLNSYFDRLSLSPMLGEFETLKITISHQTWERKIPVSKYRCGLFYFLSLNFLSFKVINWWWISILPKT